VAVKEGPAWIPAKGLEDLLGGKSCGQGEISAGQSLGQSDHIRKRILRVAGERGSDAAESGKNFVKENPGPDLAGCRGGAGRIAVRVHHHARRTLHPWLQNPGGQAISRLMDGFLGQGRALKITFPVGAGVGVFGFCTVVGATIAGRGHDFLCGEENGPKVPMKGVPVTQTHRPHGVPMVRPVRREKLGALILSALGERL